MIASDFREKARKSLNGKWQIAIIVSLIYSVVVCVLNFVGTYGGNNIIFRLIGYIASIATIVITPALTYGVTSAYMKLNKGEEVAPLDFFKLGFDNFGRSWGIIGHILRKCLGYVIALVVLYIALIIAVATTYALGITTLISTSESVVSGAATGTVGASIITIIIAIAVTVVTICFAIKALYYVLSIYLAIDNPEMTTKDAVQKSEELMKENRWKYFCLMFSFIGWALLAAIVGTLCGSIVGLLNIDLLTTFVIQIGTIVLTPYITMATIAFYEDRVGKNSNATIETNSKVEE